MVWPASAQLVSSGPAGVGEDVLWPPAARQHSVASCESMSVIFPLPDFVNMVPISTDPSVELTFIAPLTAQNKRDRHCAIQLYARSELAASN